MKNVSTQRVSVRWHLSEVFSLIATFWKIQFCNFLFFWNSAGRIASNQCYFKILLRWGPVVIQQLPISKFYVWKTFIVTGKSKIFKVRCSLKLISLEIRNHIPSNSDFFFPPKSPMEWELVTILVSWPNL